MLSVLLQRGCLTAATTRAGRGFVAAAGGGQPKGSEADDAASGDGGTGSKAETANETYANYSTANEAADDNADLDALVTASLRQVPALGWTGASIRAAVAELGWSPAAAGMLPGGGGELALRFVTRSNEQLADDLAPLESATSPSPPEPSTDASTGGDAERSKMPGASTGPPAGDRPARLQHAVRARLGMVAPYHHNWGAGLLQLARPPHTGGAARQAAVLADEIAHFAGYDDPQVRAFSACGCNRVASY